MNRRYLLSLIVLLLLAGCSAGRGCRPDNPPPPTVTPTVAPPPTIAATMTPEPSKTPSVTFTPVAATSTPRSATMTPVAELTPTPEATYPPTPTPALLGYHAVVSGDTMWDVAGKWYGGPGCYEYCGHLKWQIICDANSQIENCRMIYVNDILAIPALP